MFLHSRNYRTAVKRLIGSNPDLAVAVAFWGENAEELFSDWNGKSLRILCNLRTGGTNPSAIEALMNRKNIEVRFLDTLHAKLIVGQEEVIIGSANFSTDGLNHEYDEVTSGWHEAGLISAQRPTIRRALEWFDRRWSTAHKIKDVDLREAKANWLKRRNNRISPSRATALVDESLANLRDREIYLSIWNEDVSAEAEKQFESIRPSIEATGAQAKNIGYYEEFPELHQMPENASLISVELGEEGVLKIDGSWRRLHKFDSKIPYRKGPKGVLSVVVKESDVQGFKFRSSDWKVLARRLRPLISIDDIDKVISLHEALSRV